MWMHTNTPTDIHRSDLSVCVIILCIIILMCNYTNLQWIVALSLSTSEALCAITVFGLFQTTVFGLPHLIGFEIAQLEFITCYHKGMWQMGDSESEIHHSFLSQARGHALLFWHGLPKQEGSIFLNGLPALCVIYKNALDGLMAALILLAFDKAEIRECLQGDMLNVLSKQAAISWHSMQPGFCGWGTRPGKQHASLHCKRCSCLSR